MTKEELKSYLVNEAEMYDSVVECFDPYELINEYLKYNGICGWTDDILRVVKASGVTNTRYYEQL